MAGPIFIFNPPASFFFTGGSLYLKGSHPAGVPNSGVRILEAGRGVNFAQTGALPPVPVELRSLSLTTQNTSANTYQLQLLGDPAQKLGPRFVIAGGILTLPPGQDSVRVNGLTIAIPPNLELGLQVVRTLGAGAIGGDLLAYAELGAV